MEPERVFKVFKNDWGGRFYFTLGRGKPRLIEELRTIFFTHRGKIIGSFDIDEIIINNGSNIPRLRSLSGETSEWQIKHDRWVAICRPPFHELVDDVFHEGFRGWRYFNLAEYMKTPESEIGL